MSRFYDALREASRTQPVTSPDHEWESGADQADDAAPSSSLFGDFGITEPAVPSDFATELEPAEGAAGQEPPASALHFVPADLLNLLPVDGLTAVNGSVGTKAEVIFDERARLLPHTADSVVLEHYRR